MPQKVMVVGANGLIGGALMRVWTKQGAQVIPTTSRKPAVAAPFLYLDLRDTESIIRALDQARPELVAVPAANPFVDYCELHPEETRAINVTGTLNLARACQDRGVPIIFFSSDYVFNGQKGVYRENDPPSPINEYGRQKVEVEAAVLKLNPRNLVIRTSGAYGRQAEPKNFALQVRAKLSAGEAIFAADDTRYNPTCAENLAEATAALASAKLDGIFHVAGADRVSRHDFARLIARRFKLDESLIKPVSSREFKTPTPRPKESSLDTAKVRAAISVPMWGVSRGLDHMVEI